VRHRYRLSICIAVNTRFIERSMISRIRDSGASVHLASHGSNLLLIWHHRAHTYKQEWKTSTTDRHHKNKTCYLQDRLQRDRHIVVYAAVLLSEFRRYTHQRDCGATSTVTMIAGDRENRHGNGDRGTRVDKEQRFRKGRIFVAIITSTWPTNHENLTQPPDCVRNKTKCRWREE
jgi:hypothetical protein